MIQFGEFRAASRTIFNKSIGENHDDTGVSRKAFWEEIYLERLDEKSEFREFINSDSDMDLMVLSGHVGIGKSTFIRHKYEFAKECCGVIINMNNHRNRFRNPQTLVADLKQLVRDEYEAQIRINIKHALIHDTSYIDYSHIPPPQLPEGKLFSDGNLELKTWNYLAAKALEHLQGVPDIFNYCQQNLRDIYGGGRNEDFRDRLYNKYIENQIVASEVLDLLQWQHYIILYKILGKHQLPTILTFDNLDWTDLNVVAGQFFFSIQDILHEYNQASRLFLPERRAKAIVAVRDENLARFQFEAAASHTIIHVRFQESDYMMNKVGGTKVIGAQPNFQDDVVKRRLRYLENYLQSGYTRDVRHFSGIVQNLWMENEQMKTAVAKFRYKEFCNGSLRLMLDFIHETTCDTIQRMLQKGLDMNAESISLPVLRGRIIYSLWENDKTASILREFATSIKNELVDDYCCIFRLILVYLSRQKMERTSLKTILDDFSKLFPKRDPADFRDNIHRLYTYWEHQGELITIYQKNELRYSDNIEDDAQIRLNGRGEIFFSSVLVNLDFFGGIVAREDPKFMHHTLHEMAPRMACDYVSKIYNLVEKLAKRHETFYLNTIVPNLDHSNGPTPFAVYADKFVYNDKFHIERVGENHVSVLRSYLEECLKGPDATGLLLSGTEQQALLSIVPENKLVQAAGEEPAKRPLPKDLKDIILKFPADNAIRRIWSINEKYHEILDKAAELRGLSWEEAAERRDADRNATP
jgi:hypothetical protein